MTEIHWLSREKNEILITEYRFIYFWLPISKELKDKLGPVGKYALCFIERLYMKKHMFLEIMNCSHKFANLNADVIDYIAYFLAFTRI